jgi:hypothetical protein
VEQKPAFSQAEPQTAHSASDAASNVGPLPTQAKPTHSDERAQSSQSVAPLLSAPAPLPHWCGMGMGMESTLAPTSPSERKQVLYTVRTRHTATAEPMFTYSSTPQTHRPRACPSCGTRWHPTLPPDLACRTRASV